MNSAWLKARGDRLVYLQSRSFGSPMENRPVFYGPPIVGVTQECADGLTNAELGKIVKEALARLAPWVAEVDRP